MKNQISIAILSGLIFFCLLIIVFQPGIKSERPVLQGDRIRVAPVQKQTAPASQDPDLVNCAARIKTKSELQHKEINFYIP